MRFQGFDGEWRRARFNTLVSFKVTNSFSRENLNYHNGTVKNIHYGDIHTKFQTLFDITKEKVPYINPGLPIERIAEDNYCKEGDIIFADASENLNDVGKSIEIINLNGEKTLCGLHTLLARPITNVFYKGFVGYLLRSDNIRAQIQKESQGSKVLSISAGRISNIELSFGSISEQEKIVSFLSIVDQRIQTQNKIIEHLETSMQDLRVKIFSQKVRFQNKNGKRFPDWHQKKLGEIAKRITNKNKENNENVLTISAQFGLINQLDFFNKSVSSKNLTGYYLLEKNDFAYNKSYSNGYPMGAIKRLTRYDKGVVSTLYICFNFSSDVNLDFIEHLFESGIQNSEIEKVAQEGARNHGLLNIGISDFFNVELSIPCVEEQLMIGSFLNVIKEKINVENRLLQCYMEEKGYLLRRMFL